mmetsp:Transcript_78906/g.223303  ORF Transcript_78906/g.223303 Transcript_78906/m.223303 type:complete len:222 (-) Transcript_78906:112-777(-)
MALSDSSILAMTAACRRFWESVSIMSGSRRKSASMASRFLFRPESLSATSSGDSLRGPSSAGRLAATSAAAVPTRCSLGSAAGAPAFAPLSFCRYAKQRSGWSPPLPLPPWGGGCCCCPCLRFSSSQRASNASMSISSPSDSAARPPAGGAWLPFASYTRDLAPANCRSLNSAGGAWLSIIFLPLSCLSFSRIARRFSLAWFLTSTGPCGFNRLAAASPPA